MAETFSSRLGLRIWGAGTDTPARTEFNDIFAQLESKTVGFSSGVIGVRPAAGKGGWLFLEVNGGGTPQNLWYDTGAAWVLVADLTPSPVYQTLVWSMPGPMYTAVGKSRLYVGAASSIVSVRAAVGITPGGSAVVVDVNKNGSTIFPTQTKRPQIGVGAYWAWADLTSPTVTSLAADDYLTVDVDQVGNSNFSGTDLTVAVQIQVN